MQPSYSTGTVLLRLGLAFVFLYFGFSQLQHPVLWTSYVPHWIAGAESAQVRLVLLNGLFEVAAGVMLLFGAYTRIVALLLAVHLFSIAFSIGISPIGVRDIGLSIAALALAAMGAGSFSFDASAAKKEHERSVVQ